MENFSGISIQHLGSCRLKQKHISDLSPFKCCLRRKISPWQHRIITKRNWEAVFFPRRGGEAFMQVPKLRVRYTSRSRLQIHHSQQASSKHVLLRRGSSINKAGFNFLLYRAVIDSMREDAAPARTSYSGQTE